MNDLKTKISQEAKAFQKSGPKKRPNSSKFKPKHLSGLLILQGQDFVNQAFEVLLGRRPKPKERDHYVKALIQGRMNRIDVLGRLRHSPEGKKRKVRLRGLYVLYGIQVLARKIPRRIPVAAGFLRWSAALGTSMVRSGAPEKGEFIRDLEESKLRSRIQELEKKQQYSTQEMQKFQQWCKQRLYSLEQDWILRLDVFRKQVSGGFEAYSAVQPQAPGDGGSQEVRQAQGMPWSVYADFEDLFRGSRAEVMQGLQVLAPLACNPELPGPGEGFAHQVLDLGCGRGELLQILQEQGLSAVGVDLNPEFILRCQARGLQVEQKEVFAYLASLPEDCVPVLTGLHLVEHLPAAKRFQLLQECFRVLVPGGLVLLETPNPRNILVGSGEFYRDPGHLMPVFPDTLEFLGRVAGFEDSTVYFFNKERTLFYPAADKRFDALQDYVQVSRDFFWTGRKPA